MKETIKGVTIYEETYKMKENEGTRARGSSRRERKR